MTTIDDIDYWYIDADGEKIEDDIYPGLFIGEWFEGDLPESWPDAAAADLWLSNHDKGPDTEDIRIRWKIA